MAFWVEPRIIITGRPKAGGLNANLERVCPMTIKIGLYSEDRTLHPLLSSALGKEFQVLLELLETRVLRGEPAF